ncbi:FimV/HubP family polar landmark protein [Oxalicibacterium faecigallinarum]|uniref:Peptidoglycan-binding protein n=1 Tax=Oxalicibacterium faecigallinarum TaxID=573741 RepID=A0A8J3ALL4_9BURK|nr:FimV/HubP family polar landmark protein [Oxalicibacterium faecigallinarum]GGI16090.1 peptidoglycan-binding protein [Oxalicibacterium faecigallinarum]
MSFKMRSTSRSRVSSFKLKAVSAAVLSIAMLANAHAAGLGRLTVQSSLGQPLRAEIELTAVAADELATLSPKLAPAEAYRQANIELNPTLLSLRFAVEQRAGGPVIRVTSTQPVNEPFVDMLLELGGNRGRLIREYTFLLDPPEMRAARSTSVSPMINSQVQQAALPPPQPITPAPAPVFARAPASEVTAPVPAATPRPVARPAPAAPANPPPAPRAVVKTAEEHVVRRGDTLAKIANQYREPGVSLDQMLVALYRANPDAFVDRNMNRLRSGQILSIPAATEAETIGAAEARGVVVTQAADFNAYREKLASQVAASSARRSEEGRQSSSGSITARVQEETPANTAQDRLQLSKSGAAGANATGTTKAGGVSEEELIARDKAIAEANARVRELEKNVSDLQKLLEIKNQDLAAQQKQVETTAAANAAASPAATKPVESATPAAPAVAPVTPVTPAAEPAATAPAENAAGKDKPQAEVPATANPKPAAKPPVVLPPPPPEPSFFEDLSNNPMFLPGAAVLLALLAGLGIYSSRRRKQPAKSFEDSILSDSSLKTNSLFGSTGGQSVDTNNSVFNSNFVPSASQLDTNEVDPIAEADVYIAYGRDAQAEEILKEALRNQPDRHAVRVKLLEIYSNRGDARSFEVVATEMYGMTRGEGPEWMQAATLGLVLDPSNPLYAAGGASDAFGDSTASLTAPTQPMAPEIMQEEADAQVDGRIEPVMDTTLVLDSAALVTENNSEARIDTAEFTLPQTDNDKQPVEDLEFDLEGFGEEKEDVAEAQVPPVPAELPPDVAAIDFNFLDQSPVTQSLASTEEEKPVVSLPEPEVPVLETESVVPPPAATPEVLLPESFDLSFPGESEKVAAPAAKPEDFDLSDISLELDPSQSGDVLPALEGLDEEHYSGSAEMATKLDLALAYQEIGDKEGARELLEEVIKGGNTEQSARASELLSKLA